MYLLRTFSSLCFIVAYFGDKSNILGEVFGYSHNSCYFSRGNVIKLITNCLKWLDFFMRSNHFLSFFKSGVDIFPGMCGRSRYWLNLRGSESGPWIRTFQHSLSKEVHTICHTTK